MNPLWLLVLFLACVFVVILAYFLQPVEPAEFEWRGLVIHHSATKTGTVESFRRYHMQEKDWQDVAYHWIIYRDGSIHKGRPTTMQGMHGDKRNSSFLGICLVGNGSFNNKQTEALHNLCLDLYEQYSIKAIQSHHDRCPGPGLNVETLEKEVFAGL